MVSVQDFAQTFTNGTLFVLRHLTETPMCDFCSHEEETLLHLFWECPAVQSFWSDVSALISRDIQVELNMPLILFGLDQNVQADSV